VDAGCWSDYFSRRWSISSTTSGTSGEQLTKSPKTKANGVSKTANHNSNPQIQSSIAIKRTPEISKIQSLLQAKLESLSASAQDRTHQWTAAVLPNSALAADSASS
jgi:hypothetical protein